MSQLQRQAGAIAGLSLNAIARIAANGGTFLNAQTGEHALRGNATLREDVWEEIDQEVVRVAGQYTAIIGDLRAMGLVKNLRNAGITLTSYEKQAHTGSASRNMSGEAQATRDRSDYNKVQIPVPVTHFDIKIGYRELLASQNRGESMDLTEIAEGTRLIVESLEDLAFNGDTTLVVNGASVAGLTTHASRNTGTLTDWTDAGSRDPITDVNNMVGALYGDKYPGPYALYVPVNFWAELEDDYASAKTGTIRERILRNPLIKSIKSTSALTSEVVLVSMQRDVIELHIGEDLQVVEWEEQGGLVTRLKPLAIMTPVVKTRANGEAGFAHYSVA